MKRDAAADDPGEATTGIAIVGMAGRFPGAADLEQFWSNLAAGVESISELADAELLAGGVPAETLRDPRYVKAKGVLAGADLFDADFFHFSPREATLLDPQQRLFLECAWEAMEHAGYDPGRVDGWVGVYAGAGHPSYLLHDVISASATQAVDRYQALVANDKDFLATRVAYKLDLRGPSLSVQTACSTSLVAVHLACQGLLGYQCDMALAGGVSVSSPLADGYFYREGGIASADGHCRAFDARAGGTVFGNGLGIVVLKRLDDALNDGDTVHAVIRGSAVNNDGALKVGYTAPSVEGQAEVIELALAMADVEPDEISYVEAHGTGTPLGDPIEIAALKQVFGERTSRRAFCAIGSVKTNVGHLDTAAGIAGLIKTVLALERRTIPPSLHFTTANPQLGLEESPFYVSSTRREWRSDGSPRRAGVSSFGIGGTNAHLVLEEAPPAAASDPGRPWQLLVLSARSAEGLDAATAKLADSLERQADLCLADAAHTLQVGRKVFAHRRALVCRDVSDAAATLRGLDPERLLGQVREPIEPPLVFLFPGQGSQYVDMGRGLYEHEPAFRDAFDQCAELLAPRLGRDPRALVYSGAAGGAATKDMAAVLVQTRFCQPTLFAFEYALARMWIAWGVKPEAMIGHSIGEYVAACLAEVFPLPEALDLVARRGELMQSLPPGAMLAVPLSAAELRDRVEERGLSIAAQNAPASTVVAGSPEAVQALRRDLEREGVTCRRLHTSHAFHSAMVEPILEPFAEAVARTRRAAPVLPFLSNVTGTWITAEEATSTDYWVRHLRAPVRLSDSLAELGGEPSRLYLEVGPGRSLGSLLRDQPGAARIALPSVRHPDTREDDLRLALTTLGRLWLAGVEVDWRGFHAGARRCRVPLPTYPFERQRFWLRPAGATASSPAVATPPETAAELYVPAWRHLAPMAAPETLEAPEPGTCWVLFVDRLGLGAALEQRLLAAGHEVLTAAAAADFAWIDERRLEMVPDSRPHHSALFAELARRGLQPRRIVHLWSVTSADSFDRLLSHGFYAQVALADALRRQETGPVTLDVVSNQLHQVSAGEVTHALKATLVGPGLVIPQELPKIRCRGVDVALDGWSPTAASAALLAELTSGATDPVVALRPGERRTRHFVRLPPEAAGRPALRQSATVLITGGLGEIGLAVAEHLARRVQARLVLIGRSGLPRRERWPELLADKSLDDRSRRRIAGVRRIEALGSEVLVLAANVAREDEMRAAVDRARDRFGEIHGVIHGAGRVGTEALTTLPSLDRRAADEHFEAKVHGLLVLERVLGGEPLDFCVLLSSLAAILGGVGSTAYAAANAFMDAFAVARRGTPVWTSVNLGAWLGEQSAAQLGGSAPSTIADAFVKTGLTLEEGLAVLDRVLHLTGVPRVVVSKGDVDQQVERWVSAAPVKAAAGPELHHRPDLSVARVAPRTPLETRIAEIWEQALGVDEIGVFDNFFDLGGHSFIAVEMMARVQEICEVEVSVHRVLEYPTIAGLAAWIEGRAEVEEPETAPAASVLVRIQSGEARQQPLFLVHPVGGAVFIYRDLARRLGPRRPVFGLRAEGLEQGGRSDADIEVMAARYVAAVRREQPRGPYALGGLSLGGVIAYDMARRLQAEGEEVSLLAMLDSPGPGEMPARLDDAAATRDYLQQLAPSLAQGDDEGTAFDAENPQWDRLARFFREGIEALYRYRAEGYPGRVTFFRAAQRDTVNPLHPEHAWIDLAGGGIEIHVVPGNHINMVLEPHVAAIARVLDPILSRRA